MITEKVEQGVYGFVEDALKSKGYKKLYKHEYVGWDDKKSGEGIIYTKNFEYFVYIESNWIYKTISEVILKRVIVKSSYEK